MSLSCILIGAGNLATHLGDELNKRGIDVVQVYSRTKKSAQELAGKLDAAFTNNPSEIINNCNLYIVALKDDAINEVLPKINFNNKLIVHCSGSVSINELEKYSSNTGALYPLQTFSKTRQVNFAEIPVFIEANSGENLSFIKSIASLISNNVIEADSEKRKQLHLAAVFACNFVNHFYKLSENILKENDLDFNVVRPLINETAQKVQEMLPGEAQTGPAVRFDKSIIEKHLDLLKEKPEVENLYRLISESIFKTHQTKE